MPEPIPLVDTHAHFVTPEYVHAARSAGHIHPDGMDNWPTWSAEEHLALMDRWGVAVSMLSISSPGTHFGDDAHARALSRHVNETGAAIRTAHPHRFGHFASLPLPDVDGALAELAYAMDHLDSDGVTLESNAHGTYLGDARYEPLYAELNRRRTPVFVHPTSPPHAEEIALGRPRPMLEFLFDSTRTVSDLVFNGVFQRYPDISWIFTHGGGTLPLLTERMELFRTVFAKGSTTLDPIPEQIARLWFDMAGTPFPHQIPALTAAFGHQRLLYGSDYCWTPAAGTTAQIASIDHAPQPHGDTWRNLTTRNAQRLFTRLAPLP
ncbi:amidohydrolase family protein [Streptomyces enissocaesilis]|uniref:Amidohydrolase family protein n=1 Tax=Streptomyces enissocaesilis TaxID=332589 RepID=A0ABP6K851_9ACTN